MTADQLVAEFIVRGEPVSKSRARFTKRGSKTVAYTPERTKDGERRMALTFRSTVPGYRPADAETAYRVEAHFHNGTRQRRDVDNMLKLILDGLNGVAWLDDNQVTQVEATKSYVDKAEARTEVRVLIVGTLEPPKAPCVRCGKEFRTYESWRSDPKGKKYCSRECCYAHRVERRERVCATCSKTFLAWGESKETRFCSRVCVDEAKRADHTCSVCGSAFRGPKSLGRRKTVFCSDLCHGAYREAQDEACKHGHLWEVHGTRRKNGARYCKECARLRAAARQLAITELDPKETS